MRHLILETIWTIWCLIDKHHAHFKNNVLYTVKIINEIHKMPVHTWSIKTTWRQVNIGSINDLGPPLLIWFNFKPSMDK